MMRVACAMGCACMIAYSSSSALVPPLISNSSLLACQLFVIFKQVFVASRESPVHPNGENHNDIPSSNTREGTP